MLSEGYHKIFIAIEQVYFLVSKIIDRKTDFGIIEKPY
jgi:hypothetical protein